MTDDRSSFVREEMRRDWGRRTRAYATMSAPRNRPCAEALIELTRIAPGERVLDVATGPGVVALLAAARVGPTGSVLATDLTPEWAEIVAEGAVAAIVDDRVMFQAMGAEELDLPDQTFDVALCQFGLMFLPDPIQGLREMYRVLRPGGRLGIAVWSTVDKVQHQLVTSTILAAAPAPAAGQRLPTPLDLGEPGLIERHVATAGFREIAVTRQSFEGVYGEPEDEWQSRTSSPTGALAQAIDTIGAEEMERLHQQVITILERHRKDGRIHLTSEAILVNAVR